MRTSIEDVFKNFLKKSCLFPNFKEMQKSLFSLVSLERSYGRAEYNRVVETPEGEGGHLGVVGSMWNESHFVFLKGVKEVTVYN